uniref:Uncharacterized protein n=2 Tax=Klebsiella pneumoniae TaxID=573 RepID=A0A8F7PVG6_KLEPN|nr:hypothetical protein [Klebsiella pneumoniae]QXV89204.1 hypothetical protein [Klebsiella pneumoniae subsp. pneumoniae]QVQ58375.1 hypothetical protein [Klebsiella pneumoniae]QXV89662.1 hypothetical protein [Klebsiella pneumoniae subsp. pneumoniae]QXV90103.1 hypothetical protein [Klebsiella pneumoniae subsp. pneumoniae]
MKILEVIKVLIKNHHKSKKLGNAAHSALTNIQPFPEC